MTEKRLNIAFQMESLDEVNPVKSSSYSLMLAAQELGHICYQYSVDELSMLDGHVIARSRPVTIHHGQKPFYNFGHEKLINLADMDVVMVRNDPPYDMSYLTPTYMLSFIEEQTLIVNNPTSIRNNPEKFFPIKFKQYMAPTLITADLEAVEDFRQKQGSVGIIIKPLYMFGGEGVYHFTPDNLYLEKTFNQLIERYNAPVVVQRFLPEVAEGDKRILFVDGEVVGCFIRVPEEGSVRANLMQGGSLQKGELNKTQQKICDELGPIFKENDILISGIDVIGDYLTEINITSPIGFVEVEALYGRNISAEFWQVVEARLKS